MTQQGTLTCQVYQTLRTLQNKSEDLSKLGCYFDRHVKEDMICVVKTIVELDIKKINLKSQNLLWSAKSHLTNTAAETIFDNEPAFEECFHQWHIDEIERLLKFTKIQLNLINLRLEMSVTF